MRIREQQARSRAIGAMGDPGFGKWIKRAFKPPKVVRKLTLKKVGTFLGKAAPIATALVPGLGAVTLAGAVAKFAPKLAPAFKLGQALAPELRKIKINPPQDVYGPSPDEAPEPTPTGEGSYGPKRGFELPDLSGITGRTPGPGEFMPEPRVPVVTRDADLDVMPEARGTPGQAYGSKEFERELAEILRMLEALER